jgi:hypothetical protein
MLPAKALTVLLVEQAFLLARLESLQNLCFCQTKWIWYAAALSHSLKVPLILDLSLMES